MDRNRRRARLRRQRVQAEELLLGIAALEVHLELVRQRVVAGQVDLLQHFAFLNGEEVAVVDGAARVRASAAGEEAKRAAEAVPGGDVFAVQVRIAPVVFPAGGSGHARIGHARRAPPRLFRERRAVGEPQLGAAHRRIPAWLAGVRIAEAALDFVDGRVLRGDFIAPQVVGGNHEAACVRARTGNHAEGNLVAKAGVLIGEEAGVEIEALEVVLGDEVHHAGDGVGTVQGGGAVFEDLHPLQHHRRHHGVGVHASAAGRRHPAGGVAATVHQRQRRTLAEVAQIDGNAALAAAAVEGAGANPAAGLVGQAQQELLHVGNVRLLDVHCGNHRQRRRRILRAALDVGAGDHQLFNWPPAGAFLAGLAGLAGLFGQRRVLASQGQPGDHKCERGRAHPPQRQNSHRKQPHLPLLLSPLPIRPLRRLAHNPFRSVWNG